VLKVGINGAPRNARWYDFFAAAVAVLGMCVAEGKAGMALLGESSARSFVLLSTELISLERWPEIRGQFWEGITAAYFACRDCLVGISGLAAGVGARGGEIVVGVGVITALQSKGFLWAWYRQHND